MGIHFETGYWDRSAAYGTGLLDGILRKLDCDDAKMIEP
jgi:hypothetical protein